MKSNHTLHRFLIIKFCLVLIISLIQNPNVMAQEQNTNTIFMIKQQDVIASVQAGSLDAFENVADKWRSEQMHFRNQLLEIFNDPKSSRLNKCAAAYHLGELRAPEAADALAANIKLNLGQTIVTHLSPLMHTPVVDALVKIGNPVIPSVTRNLEESDDVQVRDLSLKVLYRIDGDKDIVQLRLQKILNAQKDSQKQARLQSGLKTLGEMQFDK